MIVDLHSDLLIDIADRRVAGERDVFRRRHLPALSAAAVRVQLLAVYVPTQHATDLALRSALRLIEAAHRDADESEGALAIVTDARQLDAALDAGAIAGILTLEGAEPLGREPELVRLFGRLGVRSVGLTWNRANDFADGTTEDRGVGITPAGHRLLAAMAEARIALDLSHLTERGATDALERAPGHVFASHSNAAAVHPTVRNVSDDVLRGVAERGGVCGLNLLPMILGPGDVGPQAAAHHDHLVAIGGERLPAIGADFVAFLPPGPSEPHHLQPPDAPDVALSSVPEPPRETAYADVRAAVAERSGDDQADALMSGNALAFLRRALA